MAEAFTRFLFTPKAQEIYAKAGYRPSNVKVFKAFASDARLVRQLRTANDFGGWVAVNQKIFDDGGLFDQAQKAAR